MPHSSEVFFTEAGIFIASQHTLVRDMVSALDEQYAIARLARDGGWDSLLVGYRYIDEGDNRQPQAVPFLSRLQAEAGEMTLGLGIFLLTLHNRVYVAGTTCRHVPVPCGVGHRPGATQAQRPAGLCGDG